MDHNTWSYRAYATVSGTEIDKAGLKTASVSTERTKLNATPLAFLSICSTLNKQGLVPWICHTQTGSLKLLHHVMARQPKRCKHTKQRAAHLNPATLTRAHNATRWQWPDDKRPTPKGNAQTAQARRPCSCGDPDCRPGVTTMARRPQNTNTMQIKSLLLFVALLLRL